MEKQKKKNGGKWEKETEKNIHIPEPADDD